MKLWNAESPPNFGINWRSHNHVSANSDYGGSGLGTEFKNGMSNGSSLTISSDSDEENNGYHDKRSRLKKCSSLKTAKAAAEESENGNKISKKIVRFADVLGLDLERVKTFMDEIPKVPLSAFKDLSITSETSSITNLSTPTAPKTVPAAPQNNASFRPQNPVEERIILPNFHQPFTQPDFYQELHDKRVKLETAYSDHSSYIIGTVRVINLGFEKKVTIRYSHDDWQTTSELEATYNPTSHDGTTDKFSFKIFMKQRLSFAIRYTVNGAEFWDNNNGANYSFNSIPNAVPSFNHVYNQVHW